MSTGGVGKQEIRLSNVHPGLAVLTDREVEPRESHDGLHLVAVNLGGHFGIVS